MFGFNRLSIIDIEHSHQPLRWGPPESPDRYVLVFNGEIYNYLELRAELAAEHGALFATEGDSEAIVAAYHYWGTGGADPAARHVRVRDLGHPASGCCSARAIRSASSRCSWRTGPAGIAFASEKKGLLELGTGLGIELGIDDRAVQHYLVLQYVPEPATLHRGDPQTRVGQLRHACGPGGQPEASAISRRGSPPTVQLRAATQALYDGSPRCCEDSVAKHMRADVTVGAFLSGGIDSTAIAALAKRHNPDLITFTTGFEREGFSEVDVAAESAAAIGVRHVIRRSVKPGRVDRRRCR